MPQKLIVSLVPSLTELLFALGAGDTLVGRTRFCTEPEGAVEAVPIVGGTKNPRVERIIGIRPTLVLANREENRREDVEALRAAGLDVLLTDPNSVPEAVAMILEVGVQLGAEVRAQALAREIVAELRVPLRAPPVRAFAAVWWNPLMGLGSQSYGHDLLERAGFANVLAAQPRYPELTLIALRDLHPDLILLPDEPFPFTASHAPEFEEIAPVKFIDGKLLWWYGPRLPEALRTFRDLAAQAATW
ncbi:MAG: helical backbone metal receptor [Tepidiformaceae bacterium]